MWIVKDGVICSEPYTMDDSRDILLTLTSFSITSINAQLLL